MTTSELIKILQTVDGDTEVMAAVHGGKPRAVEGMKLPLDDLGRLQLLLGGQQ